jgi:hypothetical protein
MRNMTVPLRRHLPAVFKRDILWLKCLRGVMLAALLGPLLAACDSKGYFHLHGSVRGLVGTGLVLLNNGEDSLRINHNGTFEFDYSYPYAYPYLVTIGTQPVGPAQNCVVTSASGRMTKDIHDVQVDCTTKYRVRGTVTGLQGTGLVLKNNSTDDLTITSGGDFSFATLLVDGSAYDVSISKSPSGQQCSIVNGSGKVDGADVTNVQVICGTLTVGGTVTGLKGTLVLENLEADNLTLTADGSFTFATALVDGKNYDVTVLTEPSGQHCVVTNGSGTLAGANITNVQVNCGFTVSGNLTGLEEGMFAILQNNGGDDLTIDLDGSFTFATPLADDAEYLVTILTSPSRQSCVVNNGAGKIDGQGITNVDIDCRTGPTVSLGYGTKQIILNWDAVFDRSGNAPVQEQYRVMKSIDAGDTYTQISTDETALSYTDTLPVHLTDWANLRYKVQSCLDLADDTTCNDSNIVTGLDDTLATGYAKAANPGNGDNFGSAIALSGDGNTLAIGAPQEGGAGDAAPGSGAVYLLTRNGTTGDWDQQAYIKASNAEAQDGFGTSVAISQDGNTLVIGSPGEDSATAVNQNDNTALNSGAIYIFTRDGSDWEQQAYVKASNIGAQDNFGAAVALSNDGTTLAVGAYFEDSAATGTLNDGSAGSDDNTRTDSGAVYVLTEAGGIWTQQAYIKASNTGAGDQFGNTLSLSSDGDTLAVGARREDSAGAEADDSATDSGAVYVFARTNTTWAQEKYIKASNIGASDLFGNALALSADGATLAVGAYLEDSAVDDTEHDGSAAEDDNTRINSGAVYIFDRNGTDWSQQAYIKASNTGAGDQFGNALALSGDGNTLAVGGNLEDGSAVGVNDSVQTDGAIDSGATYVFTRTDDAWAQQSLVKAPNTGASDNFGYAVGLSNDGETLAVGAIQEDGDGLDDEGNPVVLGGDQTDNSVSNSGAVYIY